MFKPAIEMCKNGFKVTKTLATAINLSESSIRADKELTSIYINQATNKTFQENDVIFMFKLAKTLEIISQNNITSFYDGDLTKSIIEEINENGINLQ